jgi:hypothetical protein
MWRWKKKKINLEIDGNAFTIVNIYASNDIQDETDQRYLEFHFAIDKTKRGPGYWKLNVSYLDNEKYKKGIIDIIENILIDWLFTVLRPAQEYFTYMETSPLPVKGCKI